MEEKNNKRPRRAKIKKEDKNEIDAFIERPVPEEEEVEYFEKAVRAQKWRGDIERNLQSIYEDREGRLIDVKRIKKRRPRMAIIRVFKWLVAIFLLGLAGYLSYQYFSDPSRGGQSLELTVQAPSEIDAAQEFAYQFSYRNLTRQPIRNIRLEVVLPENFVFASSSSASTTPGIYELDDINPRGSGLLEVKGKIINTEGSVNVASAKMRYGVGDFSSEFLKEAAANTIVRSVGLTAKLDYADVALSGGQQAMSLSLGNVTRESFGPLRINVILPQGASWSGEAQGTLEAPEGSTIKTEKASESAWVLSGLDTNLGEANISWLYAIDGVETAEIYLSLEEQDESGAYHPLWQQRAEIEVVKSDLSLTLLANGSKSDNSIGFGERLEYMLSYENHGSSSLDDVILMANISGDLVDWDSLQAVTPGNVASGAIIWDKSSYPALSTIEPGEKGELRFSLSAKDFDETQLASDSAISAYAQYKLSDSGTLADEHNRSNSIRTVLNSDFALSEKIMYFNDDNIPVGFGPLPPQAGQTSGFKVYWTVRNNLHELSDVEVRMTLPAYMNFEGGEKAGAGSLYYDQSSRTVIWDIGRLPVSVYRADSEFSISITPSDSDRNKILVISSGTEASAIDTVTSANLQKKVDPKTTKLEDDEIAKLSNSGIVQ